VKRVLAFLVFLFVLPNALAEGYDLPLDSLSELTGKKAISVVSNVPDLDKDTEFLALLGRLSVRGFDVNFGRSGFSDEGLVLEVLEVNDKIAISIKSADSQKYLLSTFVDQAQQATSVTDFSTSPQRILPLPAGFNPERVEALPGSARADSRLIFLSNATLALGSLKDGNIQVIDKLQSDIKNSKAIYLSIGQSDSDPNPEIAVVWGQDRDISGKGQYTKIYSQLFEVSGEELREETEKTENVAIRFINNQLHVQRYELLAGDIGKLMVASVKGSGIGAGEESSSLSDREIFSVFPIDDATRVSVAESYLELQSPGGKPFPRLELGRVSLPRVAMPLKEREIVTTPDYAYSVNEQYLSIPRKVMAEEGEVITFLRKRRGAFAGLTSASGSDVMVSASWDRSSPGAGFSITPIREINSFVIDFSYVITGDESILVVLANEESDSQGASHIYIYSVPSG